MNAIKALFAIIIAAYIGAFVEVMPMPKNINFCFKPHQTANPKAK
ncbi:hypothetical protein [Intestinibacter sp.]|nr:hypothetical protein [Intestinibacter sp.]MDY2736438.1 hypothetical protein [Intestinibacter sp.]MDY4576293.1 hypothetical protein [Intestinibacter sp.]